MTTEYKGEEEEQTVFLKNRFIFFKRTDRLFRKADRLFRQSIYTINKDHLLPQVIWALKLGLVLAFCGCVWLLLFVMFTPMAAMLFKLLIILINKFF